MMSENERRLALMSIGRRDLYNIVDVDHIVLKNGAMIKYEGIPDDARLVHYYLNPAYDSLDLVIESASFPDTQEGMELPRPNYELTSTPSETEEEIIDTTIKVLFDVNNTSIETIIEDE